MISGNSAAYDISFIAYFANDSQSTQPPTVLTAQWLKEMCVAVFGLMQIGVRCFFWEGWEVLFLKISLCGFNRLYTGVYKRGSPTAGVKGRFRQWAPFWRQARAARSIWIGLRLALCRPGVWRAIERLFTLRFFLFCFLNTSKVTDSDFNDMRIIDVVICTPRSLY